jgi:hypothetical protein
MITKTILFLHEALQNNGNTTIIIIIIIIINVLILRQGLTL